MVKTRRFPLKLMFRFALLPFTAGALWAALVATLYAFQEFRFLRVPFLPISTIGIAVAFYVGFKNNAAYDRFWEGRKIWGGIVNTSRTWSTAVMSYIQPGDASPEAHALRKVLIYRQLAWINALRLQLRKTSRFFDKPVRSTRERLDAHAEIMRNDWDKEISPYLSPEEFEILSALKNPATHILTRQGTHLAALYREAQLDLFHQIAMMELIEELYGLQGKCERIKNTPFPRQYAEYSRLFTRVFAFLVPFGLLDVFAEAIHGAQGGLQSIGTIVPMVVAGGLITWVFNSMEGIGDASEDPFERSMNDVPMNALCRAIEVDLLQMLGETELPPPEQAVDHILY